MTHPAQPPPAPLPGDDTIRRPAETVDPAAAATRLRPTAPPTAPHAPLLGRRLGKYELVAQLGRGGMGVVYKAYHPGLQAYFALKVLLAGNDASPDEVERFHREAKASARLKHPGIVAVHDLGEEDGKSWIAMELVEGASLDAVLADPVKFGIAPARPRPGAPRAGLNPTSALRLTQGIAEAIHAAHEAGVIHRDLKPLNVMLEPSGRPKVMDFGLARLVDAAGGTGRTRTGALMGTPAYMSPEQAEGRVSDVDARSDVYQLGAILYEMLTGRAPYTGTSPMDVVVQVLGQDPPPPRTLNPAIDRDAATICTKALAREKGARYASARELADDCGRYLAGEAIHARPEPWWDRTRRWARRRRWLVTAAGALLVAGLAIGWGALAREGAGRESAAAQAKVRTLLERIGRAVDRYEDHVMRLEMSPAVRRALAEQPMELLDGLIAEDPEFGPAYSYRGKVRELLDPKATAAAEADYDRGCALSPERAVVWYLRGMHHIEIYGASRGLPGVSMAANDVAFAPALPERAEEKCRREQGLDDLTRMVREAEQDPTFGEEEARLGQALAGLHRGGDAECRNVLRLLDGIERPKATRVKARALFYLKRLEESAAVLRGTLEEWPEDADAWLTVGMVEFAAGMRASGRGEDPRPWYGRAVANLGEALRRAPENAVLYNDRGNVYQSLGDAHAERGLDARESYTLAVADLDEALRCNPEFALAYGNRGCAFERLAELEAKRGLDPSESFGRALADFEEALRRDPDRPSVYLSRGKGYLHRGEREAALGIDPRETFDKALADFGEALRHDPEDAIARHHRGSVYLRLGEGEAARGLDPRGTLGRALAEYGEALRRNPDLAETYNNRSVVHLDLGDAKAALGLDPRNSYGEALADIDEALRRNPGQPEFYNQRGVVYARRSEAEAALGLDPRESFDRALADFGEALRLDPEQATAYTHRGDAYLEWSAREAARGIDPRGSYRKAVADYGEALRFDPEDAQVVKARGNVYLKLGEAEAARGLDPRETFAKGRADFDEVLRRDPNDAHAFNNRGSIYWLVGVAEAARGLDPEQSFRNAESDFLSAVQRNIPQPHFNLGLLYRSQRRFEEAIAAFETGAKALPEQAGWAQDRIRETRLLAAAESGGAATEPWARELALAERSIRAGGYPDARARYEKGLALFEDTLREMTADQRTRRLSDLEIGVDLRNAHYNLACILALASTGREGPEAPARALSADDAARARDAAFAHLDEAIRLGWNDADHLKVDTDLAALHADERWNELLANLERPKKPR